MKRFIIAFIMIFLSGCMPYKPINGIFTSTSEFDGTVTVSTYPSWVCKDQGKVCNILLELYRTSKMQKGQAIVKVYARKIIQKSSLPVKINIDGDIIALHPIDDLSEISTTVSASGPMPLEYGGPWSMMRYDINFKMVYRLISALRVVVQVEDGKEIVEGVFTEPMPENYSAWSARYAFKEFYNNIPSVEL